MTQLRGLLLQLTRKCPLECNHCYVTASPRERATLPAHLTLQALEEYAALPEADKAVCFTGGDPFAVLHLLSAAVRRAHQLDYFVHVNTSAFFARSVSAGLKVLRRVEGLSQLEVSIDKEHQRFVPIDNVHHALAAAKILNVPAQLAIQAEDRASHDVLKILEEFPETTLYVQNYAPVGERNKRAFDHPDLMPKRSSHGCDKVGSIFIDEFGYVFPCTSAVVSSQSTNSEVRRYFALGRLDEKPLSAMIHELTSLRLRSVKCMGPSAVRQFLEGNEVDRDFRSYCDECVYLATSNVVKIHEGNSMGEMLKWAMQ